MVSQSPLQAEMFAIREAALYASKQNNRRFIIESDCLEAVNICKSSTEERQWEVDVLWEEIRRLVSINDNVIFNYVSRKGNQLADWLCKNNSAITFSNSIFNVHPVFMNLVLKDQVM